MLPTWLIMWSPIIIGLLALYFPMYLKLSTTLWLGEEQAHGPIVLAVVLFLAYEKRDTIADVYGKSILNSKGSLVSYIEPSIGLFMFITGLLCFIIGHSQGIHILEIGSQIPVIAGILLMTLGVSALKAMWFPLLFIIFRLPLPGFFLDAVTMPMKMAVSYVVDNVLFWFDYPISREGVILQIGQYKLLVADACAGMHTLVSLEALGLLYLQLVKHNSLFRNLTLASLIIPISFTANVTRVIVLSLVTYYYGDAVGQGFIHGFAGLLLFAVALMLTIGADALLHYAENCWRVRRSFKND